MASIKPSTIQSWLRGLDALAWTYRRVIFANVSTIFSTAVDDEVLAKNPCKAASVRAPRGEHGKVTPWTREEVLAVRAALPDRYRIVVALGAGQGLRQGEIFGLSPDDVDFLRGRVEVRRQVKLFNGNRQVFGPPKGGKTRIVPLPESVRAELAAHLKRFPPIQVTLPTGSPDGALASESLVISSRERKSLNQNYFNSAHWRKALAAAGLEASRANGWHALRHFHASTLLDAGESIKAVSQYLGHADPGFTLRTYTHLMPASDEHTRRAVVEVLGVTGVYQPVKTPESPQVTGGSNEGSATSDAHGSLTCWLLPETAADLRDRLWRIAASAAVWRWRVSWTCSGGPADQAEAPDGNDPHPWRAVRLWLWERQ